MSNFTIRSATQDDVPAMTGLYNHYVENTAITFDIEPWTVHARREWFAQFSDTGRHRMLVAEQDGQFLGYTCSTRFRPKAAYDTTIEVTIYTSADNFRKGIGRALYTELFKVLAQEDLHRAVAIITLPNDASIAFHEAFGFEHKGTLDEIGRKFDKYWTVSWYEKSLD